MGCAAYTIANALQFLCCFSEIKKIKEWAFASFISFLSFGSVARLEDEGLGLGLRRCGLLDWLLLGHRRCGRGSRRLLGRRGRGLLC